MRNVRHLLSRTKKLEKSQSSHFLQYIGSLEKWETDIKTAIAEGRMCNHDGPMLIQVMHRWVNETV